MMAADFRPSRYAEQVLELLALVIFISGITTLTGAPVEICETESFKASCAKNKVIVMTSAMYGRMRMGRCVKKSLGYLGCYKDVLPLADRRCSGLQECEIRMPDPEFDRTAPCLEELKTYFEASHTCVEVLVPPNHCSHGGDRWIISNTASGTISNNIALSTNCATEQLPLEIKAFPGQRINLTLYDFNTPYLSEQTMQYDASSHVRCDEFVNILDNNAKSKTKLCPGNERVKHGYLSTNDSLLVYFKRIPSAQKSKRFLLEFEVIGCKDLVPQEGMYFRRHSNEAEVGCLRTSEVWSLVCIGGRWKGDIGNCTSAFLPEILQGDPQTKKLPYGVTIGIILSLALVIGLIVLVLGIVFLRKMQKSSCTDEAEDGSDTVEMKRVHEKIHICPHNFNLIPAAALDENNLTKLQDDPAFKDNPSNDYAPVKFHTFKTSMLKQPHEECHEGLLSSREPHPQLYHMPSKAVYVHAQGPADNKNTMQYMYHGTMSPPMGPHHQCVKDGEQLVHTCGRSIDKMGGAGGQNCDTIYDRARYCGHDAKKEGNNQGSVTLPRKPSFVLNNSF